MRGSAVDTTSWSSMAMMRVSSSPGKTIRISRRGPEGASHARQGAEAVAESTFDVLEPVFADAEGALDLVEAALAALEPAFVVTETAPDEE